MASAASNGITIEYETFGDPTLPTLMLVNGLGSQLINYDVQLCAMFVDHGLHVVRFDNRDVGLSTKVDSHYLLTDMAQDAFGVLDHLGIERAHIAGMSMGGMIVQTMAILHPERVLSMCSVMSRPANDRGPSTPAAIAALMSSPPVQREAFIEHSVESQRIIASVGLGNTEQRWRDRAAASFDRCFYPEGRSHQLAAVGASPDRRPGLAALTMPVLVIHGADDPLITLPGGEATAAAIPGAELLVIPGMAHDLPPDTWTTIVGAIVANGLKAR